MYHAKLIEMIAEATNLGGDLLDRSHFKALKIDIRLLLFYDLVPSQFGILL